MSTYSIAYRKRKRDEHDGQISYESDTSCPKHPDCKTKQSDNGMCTRCNVVRRMINSAKSHTITLRKNRTIPDVEITKQDILQLEGSLCELCKRHVFTGTNSRDKRQLSLNQRIPGGGYTKNNVGPTCLQCNYVTKDRTYEDTLAQLEKIRVFHDENDAAYQHGPFEWLYYNDKTQKCRRTFYWYRLKTKRGKAKSSWGNKEGFVFELDKEWMLSKLHVQCGQCAICGDYLRHDVSFDKITPSPNYTKENVQLTHEWCNNMKNMWPLEDLLDLARHVHKI
jgi:hypothetical protein